MFTVACGIPAYDPSATHQTDQAIQTILTGVDLSLSAGDCTGALDAILPLYNSIQTSNKIRMATASAYGCYAGIRLLQVMSDLIAFGGDLNGSGFFEFMVQEFPDSSTTDNKTAQAAMDGIDAAMASIRPGTITVPAYILNGTSGNPQAILSSDRTDDSNSFLTFLAMAQMGSQMNRSGAPLANHHKSTPLPWASATLTQGEGCAFASALLVFKDGISDIAAQSPPKAAAMYATIQTFLNAGMDAACQLGCALCTLTCTTCPLALRDRTVCTGLATDINSCAAAGIISFVNAGWTGPP